jgi:hypothetical protein
LVSPSSSCTTRHTTANTIPWRGAGGFCNSTGTALSWSMPRLYRCGAPPRGPALSLDRGVSGVGEGAIERDQRDNQGLPPATAKTCVRCGSRYGQDAKSPRKY